MSKIEEIVLKASEKLSSDKGMKLDNFTQEVKNLVPDDLKSKITKEVVSSAIRSINLECSLGGNPPKMTIANGKGGGVWLGTGPVRQPSNAPNKKEIAANLASKGGESVNTHFKAMVDKCALASACLGKTKQQVLQEFAELANRAIEESFNEFESEPFEPTKTTK